MSKKLKWAFLSPALILILLLIIFPIFYNLYLSFHTWFGNPKKPPIFVGLSNYVGAFKDSRFINSLYVTAYFTLLALALEVVIGFLMAVYINREYKGKNLVKALLVFPFTATPVAIALVWRIMYDPTLGVINYFLSFFGIKNVLWLSNPKIVIPALVIVDVWEWTPLVTLISLAGLESISASIIEAAKIDGASRSQTLFHIILPMMKPTLIAATMIRSWDCIKTFDIIYVMTQGGPGYASENLNIYAFNNAFRYFNMGYASSLMVILFAIVIGVNLILYQFRGSNT
ncbi:MAG: multiple sugar transport system permease protein [Thermotogota bacterium]|nr:multiple sugar transport system permease protein [Thermotogota bacterium]HCZ05553.1 sugar ABC transporter permease [Thermotogota bacterium]